MYEISTDPAGKIAKVTLSENFFDQKREQVMLFLYLTHRKVTDYCVGALRESLGRLDPDGIFCNLLELRGSKDETIIEEVLPEMENNLKSLYTKNPFLFFVYRFMILSMNFSASLNAAVNKIAAEVKAQPFSSSFVPSELENQVKKQAAFCLREMFGRGHGGFTEGDGLALGLDLDTVSVAVEHGTQADWMQLLLSASPEDVWPAQASVAASSAQLPSAPRDVVVHVEVPKSVSSLMLSYQIRVEQSRISEISFDKDFFQDSNRLGVFKFLLHLLHLNAELLNPHLVPLMKLVFPNLMRLPLAAITFLSLALSPRNEGAMIKEVPGMKKHLLAQYEDSPLDFFLLRFLILSMGFSNDFLVAMNNSLRAPLEIGFFPLLCRRISDGHQAGNTCIAGAFILADLVQAGHIALTAQDVRALGFNEVDAASILRNSREEQILALRCFGQEVQRGITCFEGSKNQPAANLSAASQAPSIELHVHNNSVVKIVMPDTFLSEEALLAFFFQLATTSEISSISRFCWEVMESCLEKYGIRLFHLLDTVQHYVQCMERSESFSFGNTLALVRSELLGLKTPLLFFGFCCLIDLMRLPKSIQEMTRGMRKDFCETSAAASDLGEVQRRASVALQSALPLSFLRSQEQERERVAEAEPGARIGSPSLRPR